jgi:hypothetical protein
MQTHEHGPEFESRHFNLIGTNIIACSAGKNYYAIKDAFIVAYTVQL